MADVHRRNKWTFAVGTTGRDAVYTLVSMYFIYYLTEIVQVSDAVLAWVSSLILAARLFDAVMDIVMGSVVDNTRTRWGQYKPWIFIGMIASAVFTVLLFTDMSSGSAVTVVIFALFYLLWSLSWTANDIPYWSLMPALTLVQKQREQIGSLAKIFATIGQFAVVGTIIPIVGAAGGDNPGGVLVQAFGAKTGWVVYVLIIVTVMALGQTITLVGTKVPSLVIEQEKVTLRQVYKVVFDNDQLMWAAIAMVLFMTGFTTTTTFGTYFFTYAYRDASMYTVFGVIMGVSMITGYLVFPLLRKRFNRRALYTLATGLVSAGYIVFFFSPMNIVILGVAGVLLFIGDAFVTVLMLMFIADSIDYGHWKLGRRNTAITFALQPFINKVGAALSAQVVALVLIWSGINAAQGNPDDVTSGGLVVMKVWMMVFPLALTLIGYFLYRWKYRIDEAFYDRIIKDLTQRGQLTDQGSAV
ncbi:MAG: glycoside-pentoside-hexuronide (GPH):cation symporter [Propionibacteriaceae bacterium]|jgi:melibiose permease/lactose/raffinose/galactose permease|nr:glycoside-pentoside-hexuronide (GPH):cation symporter [Propionibacteriaceae bacterium]